MERTKENMLKVCKTWAEHCEDNYPCGRRLSMYVDNNRVGLLITRLESGGTWTDEMQKDFDNCYESMKLFCKNCKLKDMFNE